MCNNKPRTSIQDYRKVSVLMGNIAFAQQIAEASGRGTATKEQIDWYDKLYRAERESEYQFAVTMAAKLISEKSQLRETLESIVGTCSSHSKHNVIFAKIQELAQTTLNFTAPVDTRPVRYCYVCGCQYTTDMCPICGADIYTNRPNSQTKEPSDTNAK